MTVNFVGTGGTLGATGANPRIIFTGAGQPMTGAGHGLAHRRPTTNDVDDRLGDGKWHRVGRIRAERHRRGWSESHHRDEQRASRERPTRVWLSSTRPRISRSPANVTSATLKIQPGASGLSLNIGANNLDTHRPHACRADRLHHHRLDRTRDERRDRRDYIYVTDENTVLTLNGAAFANGRAAQQQPLTKSGAGTLALTGSTHLLPFTTNQNIYIVQGTLRGTVDGAQRRHGIRRCDYAINLRGGVLEIDGEGNARHSSRSSAPLTSPPPPTGRSIRFDAGPIRPGRRRLLGVQCSGRQSPSL